jgi:hypothetical protein
LFDLARQLERPGLQTIVASCAETIIAVDDIGRQAVDWLCAPRHDSARRCASGEPSIAPPRFVLLILRLRFRRLLSGGTTVGDGTVDATAGVDVFGDLCPNRPCWSLPWRLAALLLLEQLASEGASGQRHAAFRQNSPIPVTTIRSDILRLITRERAWHLSV